MNRDRPRRQRNWLTGSSGAMSRTAPHLAGAERRRQLVECAHETGHGRPHRGFVGDRPVAGLDRSLCVIGRAPRAKPDHGVVAL